MPQLLRQRNLTVHREGTTDKCWVYVRGHAEDVLPLCDRCTVGGRAVPMTDAQRVGYLQLAVVHVLILSVISLFFLCFF